MGKTNNKNSDKKGSKTAVLQELIRHRGLDRTTLSKLTNLSRATISSVISEFLDMGLVRETERQPSTGGRPAVSLQFSEKTHYIIGAELHRSGNSLWNLAAFDLTFNPVSVKSFHADIRTPETAVNSLLDGIAPFIKDLGKTLIPVIGIGIPGLIDTRQGIVISAPDLGWHNVNISEDIHSKMGWNCVVINHFKAHGLFECRYGTGIPFNDMIYLGVNNGIAGSLFHNRKLISGFLGGAGEIGHMTIEPRGPVCSCGNYGCLELMSAAPAIEREYSMLINTPGQKTNPTSNTPETNRQPMEAKDICLAADSGDEKALEAVQFAAAYLGIAMANLIQVYNPEAIILGGYIPRNSQMYVKVAEQVMRRRAMLPLSTSTKVQTATFTEYGGALGAANFALEKHLTFSLLCS